MIESTAVNVDTAAVAGMFSTLAAMSLPSILKIVLLVVVLLVVIRLVGNIFERFLAKSKVEKSLHGFLRAGVKVLLYFVAVMIVAGSLDVDVTSLIALLSVAGLALSLAIQGCLSNLAGGIVILTTKPMRVDDYIKIGAEEGTVQEIGMTYTKLSTVDNRVVYIPNSTVTTSNVVNYTVEGKRRVDLVVSAGYDEKMDDVKEALQSAAASVPTVMKDEEVFARVSNYGANAIEYTLRVWCKGEDYWTCYFDLLESVKRTYDEKGVKMSYQHVNVHMMSH